MEASIYYGFPRKGKFFLSMFDVLLYSFFFNKRFHTRLSKLLFESHFLVRATIVRSQGTRCLARLAEIDVENNSKHSPYTFYVPYYLIHSRVEAGFTATNASFKQDVQTNLSNNGVFDNHNCLSSVDP